MVKRSPIDRRQMTICCICGKRETHLSVVGRHRSEKDALLHPLHPLFILSLSPSLHKQTTTHTESISADWFWSPRQLHQELHIKSSLPKRKSRIWFNGHRRYWRRNRKSLPKVTCPKKCVCVSLSRKFRAHQLQFKDPNKSLPCFPESAEFAFVNK